jgi:hypothetical protein
VASIYYSSTLQLTSPVTYCSLPCPKETVGSLGGSILDLFIRMRSTSTTCRNVSWILRRRLATVTRTTNKTTPIVVLVHRRHSAMIHIAHVLITRTRGLRRHNRHHHHQQWEDTIEKVQHNLLCGHTTRYDYLIHMPHPC